MKLIFSLTAMALLLGLPATAEPQTNGGESQVNVEIQVDFMPAPPRTPGFVVWVEGKRVYAAQSNDTVVVEMSECTPNTRVEIWPADARYTAPTLYCEIPLVARVHYIQKAAQLWGQDPTRPSVPADYAHAVLPALSKIAADAASGDEAAVELWRGLDADDPGRWLADQLHAASKTADNRELALAYELLAIDVKFRLVGQEPTQGLLRVAEGLNSPVLTEEGSTVLTEIDPGWLPALPIEGVNKRVVDAITGSGEFGRLVLANDLSGVPVLNEDGEQVGLINGIAADGQGSVVVEAGGFLGLGGREVALPSDQIRLTENGREAITSLSEKDLEFLPEFEQELFADDAEIEFRFGGSM